MGVTSLLVLILGVCSVLCQKLDCRTDEIQSCIKLADPLLKDPKYVFPASKEDIGHVCTVLFPRTWSDFVSCIRRYTDSCLSQDQRGDFNKAVGDSINSVHKMCTNSDYQKEYLQHAQCIKERSTDEIYCGTHYNTLISQVQGAQEASKKELCCSHNSFKECVLAETESCHCEGDECRRGMSAQQFARTMLDKALGFLLKQCHDYVPNTRDCIQYVRPEPEVPDYQNLDKQPRFDDDLENDRGNPEEAGSFLLAQSDITTTARYEGGNYFPSGSRDQDRWEDRTDSPNNHREVEVINSLPVTDNSLVEPFRPSPEEERNVKPWLPQTDIRNFDEIFNNAVDESLAAGLASNNGAAGSGAGSAAAIFIGLLAAILMRW